MNHKEIFNICLQEARDILQDHIQYADDQPISPIERELAFVLFEHELKRRLLNEE